MNEMRTVFVWYGRWYYEHASSHMPTMTTEDGKPWARWEAYVEAGETVQIRPATRKEHAKMAEQFDEVTDRMASEGWVYGVGNFERDNPPPGLADAVAGVKARARTRT